MSDMASGKEGTIPFRAGEAEARPKITKENWREHFEGSTEQAMEAAVADEYAALPAETVPSPAPEFHAGSNNVDDSGEGAQRTARYVMTRMQGQPVPSQEAQLSLEEQNAAIQRTSEVFQAGYRLGKQVGREDAEAAQYVDDGQWICQSCVFQLTKAILRASDGAVGVDRSEAQDICPNDGTSLRRLTWKEDAANANRVGLEQMKRADALEADLARVTAQAEAQREWLATANDSIAYLQAKLAAKEAASVTVSPIREGDENDGRLMSTDIFATWEGGSLLVNIPCDSTATYAFRRVGEAKSGTIQRRIEAAHEAAGPSVASLRELVAKWRAVSVEIAPFIQGTPYTDDCADDLEALLPSPPMETQK